jgi:hypothetical protein
MYFSINQFLLWHILAFVVGLSVFSNLFTSRGAFAYRLCRFKRARRLRVPSVGSNYSAASDHINQRQDQGNHQQDVYEAAGQVKAPSEKPENDQDCEDGPEHKFPQQIGTRK